MDSSVIDAFWTAHCSNVSVAIAIRILPTALPNVDPFATTDWNDFCAWLIRTYVKPAHLEQLQRHIKTIKCKGVDKVTAYVNEFNETCIYVDYLSGLISGRFASGDLLSVLGNVDTSERKGHFRNALPEVINERLLAFETLNRTVDAEWDWSLALMQEHATTAATVLKENALRQLEHKPTSTALHHLHDGARAGASGATPPVAAATATETMLAAALHVMSDLRDMMANGGATPGPFLAIDDDEPTVIELHLKISEVMKDPPSPELIKQRLNARSCLACGEKSSHTKFLECPKLLAMQGMAARIESLVAADRARRDSKSANARVHHMDAGGEEVEDA